MLIGVAAHFFLHVPIRGRRQGGRAPAQVKGAGLRAPLLDAADFVFRYAWMSARDASGRRGLVETVDGKARLTELGEVWNS